MSQTKLEVNETAARGGGVEWWIKGLGARGAWTMAVKLKLDDFFFEWVSGVVGPNVVSLPDNADTIIT